jgi:osmotically-inducible protein OsmY
MMSWPGWAVECQACRRTKRRSTAVPEGGEATARNGNLTLTGAVKYPSQRAAAESAVGGLTGVRKTEDEIGFVFDADPANVNSLVEEALAEHKVPVDDSRVVTNISGTRSR